MEAGKRVEISDPRDGHLEVRTGKECVMDFGDVTDDGEVLLNVPREEDMEQNLPGEDVRDLQGDTASGASVINQEERYRLEPPNGARPKWTRPGLPLPVIEEPRSPGAGATVGAGDFERNGGEMGVPGPVLPPFRQDQQGAGVTTPTRMDADRCGGPRSPEGRMPRGHV